MCALIIYTICEQMIAANYEQLAALVRERRLELGLSTQSLAERAGISATRINQIENLSLSETTGKRRGIKPETIEKLAHALSMPTARLLVLAGYAPKVSNDAARSALERSDFAALFFESEGLTTEEARRDVEVGIDMLRNLIRQRKLEEDRAKSSRND